MTKEPCLLTIAGTDPSGGAGIQVDLQVFRDWGFHGLSVITAVVCQNTAGVKRFEGLSARLVEDQLDAILEDVEPVGIKIGMVSRAEVVDVVAAAVEKVRDKSGCPVVFDPVMASGARQTLQRPGTVEAMRQRLIPLVDVLTPNVDEAEVLLDTKIESRRQFEEAAVDLLELGCRAVLLKSGHLPRTDGRVADVLADADGLHILESLEAIDEDVRGTGCQLSSAVVAALVQGRPVVEAAEAARRYLNELLHTQTRRIGRGRPLVVRSEDVRSEDVRSEDVRSEIVRAETDKTRGSEKTHE
jgi:hydroxymethylpyrimidine/phosphomethylpyrimidine kinase